MDRRIERTRAAVIEAAVALVSSRGSQVGMTEIADAAGVSRKAVYENFGSRDRVLRSATETLLARVPHGREDERANPWDAVLPPIAQHIEAFRDYYRSVLSGPGCFTVRDAVVGHAVAGLRHARERGENPVGPGAGACDRFIVHGLVGVVADTLVQQRNANLQKLVSALTAGLAKSAPSR